MRHDTNALPRHKKYHMQIVNKVTMPYLYIELIHELHTKYVCTTLINKQIARNLISPFKVIVMTTSLLQKTRV